MSRSNCLFWAIGQRLRYGGQLRIQQSPMFPLLPRTSWRSPLDGRWYRYMHIETPTADTFLRKWFPLHAIWFKGQPRKTK